MIIIQITSGYFCAGLLVDDKTVTKTAPIIKYMRGWEFEKVIDYCWKKRWKLNWWIGNITKP